jgi:hypothetical protein
MVYWGRGYGATTPSHLSLKAVGPLWTAFVVPPVNSRGAPRQATRETSVSERRNYGQENGRQILPSFGEFHTKWRIL